MNKEGSVENIDSSSLYRVEMTNTNNHDTPTHRPLNHII
jgi:hypothetical protein